MAQLSWNESWLEHLQQAICINMLNRGKLTLTDLLAIRSRVRRASLELTREIAAWRLDPPRTTCRYCGELEIVRDELCAGCLKADLADLEAYGEDAVDLHSFKSGK